MKRKITAGLTLVALVGLGTLAVFAADEVISARANSGPRFAQHMVARRDVGTGGPGVKPTGPTKPPQIDQSARVGGGLPGHPGRAGGAIPTASVSPQMALENNLKSLALELR
jgi:hypothetical protein